MNRGKIVAHDMAQSCEMEMQGGKRTESRTRTGLKDAFKVVSLASQERLQSLTFKMGSSQAEVLVHAMCLIHLKKGQEALGKLESLPGSSIARYLAEMAKTCHESLVDFNTDSLHSLETQVDVLIELARIFRVLAKEQLCSESQRDEAYQLALWASKSKMAGREDWDNQHVEQLMREAKEASGLHVVTTGSAEYSCPQGRTLRSSLEHCSVYLCGDRDLDRGSTAIPIQSGQRGSSVKSGEHSSPSSLRSSSPDEMSFPSHLEVSASPTIEFGAAHRTNRDVKDLKPIPLQEPEDDVAPHPSVPASETRLLNPLAEEHVRESVSTSPAPSSHMPVPHVSPQPTSTHFVLSTENHETGSTLASKNSDPKAQLRMGSSLKQISKTFAPALPSDKMNIEAQTDEKRFGNISMTISPQNESEDKDNEEEEEEFFSFVIFHASEDMDMAEELQAKLEGLGIGEGAIFSQDFQTPGRFKLKCIEDAIDNSAFTILLLSRNFKNQLNEFQTNSALMNSIEKRHKYNSVIPLLPSKNCMSQKDIPRPLGIYVALNEKNRSFEKLVKKTFAPEKIRKQKQLWRQDLLIRKQQEKQDILREKIKRNEVLAHEITKTTQLEKTQLYMLQQQQIQTAMHYPATGPPVPIPEMPQQAFYNPDWPLSVNVPLGLHPNIHIENASCIMFGNNSQMTVGAAAENCGGDEGLDESNDVQGGPGENSE